MAHLPRYFVPGLPLHVIQRGNNREPIFAGEDDYRFYLRKRTGSGLSLKHGVRHGIIESMARPFLIRKLAITANAATLDHQMGVMNASNNKSHYTIATYGNQPELFNRF